MAGSETTLSADFVIVGGGIAAVTCAETLADECPESKVILITASPLVKAVTNYQKVSRTLETFDVEEKPTSLVESQCPNVMVLQASVTALQSADKTLTTSDGKTVHYNKVCLCTGGKPKLIPGSNGYVVGIRDTGSVKDFQKKLSTAKRVVVVGNGGIASELVYEVEGCEVIWAIRHQSISSAFVDEGAAQFFLPHLQQEKKTASATVRRQKYAIDDQAEEEEGEKEEGGEARTLGSALGPDWAAARPMKGSGDVEGCVHVEYGVEVVRVMDPSQLADSGLQPCTPPGFSHSPQQGWRVFVELTNGQVYGCDLVVSATGVRPFTDPFLAANAFEVAEDGGLKVDDKLQTSVLDVYAAGDLCTASWQMADLWIQRRLWTQARQMGSYAARSMVAATKGESITLDICFELFAHVTKLFGYKVVLIGLFNAQGLGTDYELLLRVTKGEEFVKVVLHNGRLVGAILIGETDLEETFENLALNQIDLTPLKDHLLDPAVDIDDFFD
ncbi:pyridine nucleotide-disulfide oxidoreductase domain-containing protein 1-like [Babylonia areolata]|uniref:pyridine nucleotide-disulfide oxidoreductase domain-containing protein 1-like n=1 Tax=Babylonia areolata TaxID=304850 RepID=UPI003FD13378